MLLFSYYYHSLMGLDCVQDAMCPYRLHNFPLGRLCC